MAGVDRHGNASPMSPGSCCQIVASRFLPLSYHTGISGFRKAGELGFEARNPAGQQQGDYIVTALAHESYGKSPCQCHLDQMAPKWPILSRFCPDDFPSARLSSNLSSSKSTTATSRRQRTYRRDVWKQVDRTRVYQGHAFCTPQAQRYGHSGTDSRLLPARLSSVRFREPHDQRLGA